MSLTLVQLQDEKPAAQCKLVSESLFGLLSTRPADWRAKLTSRTVPVFTTGNEKFDKEKPFALSCEWVPIVAIKPEPDLRFWADGARIQEMTSSRVKAAAMKALQVWGEVQCLEDNCVALINMRRAIRNQISRLGWHRAPTPVGVLRGW